MAVELAKIGTTSTNLVKDYIPQWARNGHCHTNTMLGNKHKHTIKSLNEQLINNRIHYRAALQLINGHIGLNKHLYNMNITNTTKCPACDYETETVTHFISQCPAYSQSGLTTSILTTPIPMTYLTNKASPALSVML